jgi:hypothetical protein
MKAISTSKKAVAVLMAVLMVAAVVTVSAFATSSPVSGKYFYEYKDPAGGTDLDYYPAPMGSETVRNYYYDAEADKYYVDFQVMNYNGFIGYVNTFTVNDGSDSSLVITDAFDQYILNAPANVNMNTYLSAYKGTTHTLVYSASAYGAFVEIDNGALSFTIYRPNGTTFTHPPITNPYIALYDDEDEEEVE